MTAPLVSIVTPTFNQEEHLAECIESVLAQTYPHWEQIIVDDGSTDGTPGVIDRYRDPRIQYIRLPHRGLGSLAESYNTALAAARGELVAVLEGDDVWPVDKLETSCDAFRDPEVLLVWGRGELIDADGKPAGIRTTVETSQPVRRFDHREIFERLTCRNVLAPTVTVMVRRDALERAGGFTQAGSSLFVDLPTWLRVMATSVGTVCFVNRNLGFYRLHSGQTTQRHGPTMATEHLSAVLQVETTLSLEQLRSVGWNSGVRRRAVVAGHLGAGMTNLSGRHFHAARSSFADAFHHADRVSDRVKAGLGLGSAWVRSDLFGAAIRLRDSVRGAVRGMYSRHA